MIGLGIDPAIDLGIARANDLGAGTAVETARGTARGAPPGVGPRTAPGIVLGTALGTVLEIVRRTAPGTAAGPGGIGQGRGAETAGEPFDTIFWLEEIVVDMVLGFRSSRQGFAWAQFRGLRVVPDPGRRWLESRGGSRCGLVERAR